MSTKSLNEPDRSLVASCSRVAAESSKIHIVLFPVLGFSASSVAGILLLYFILFFILFRIHLLLSAFRPLQNEVVVVKLVRSSMNVAFPQGNLVYDNTSDICNLRSSSCPSHAQVQALEIGLLVERTQTLS